MNWLLKLNWLGKVFAWLQGRTTAFCLLFFVSGNVLQWLHRLDLNYIAFMTALLGAVIGHSVKEDMLTPAAPPIPPTTGGTN